MHRINKKTRLLIPCLQAIGSTAAAVGIIFILNCGYTWIWVLNHDPAPGETFRYDYLTCLVRSSTFLALQIPMFLSAGIIIAIVRGRHRMVVGIFSGVLLFALTITTLSMGFLPDTIVSSMVYHLGFPLLVSALQWWPERKNRKTSNKSLHLT